MENMQMPDLPHEILTDIVKRVGANRWWLLGPILKSGRKGRDIVYLNEVLKEARIYSLCDDPSDIHLQGRYRPFLKKCFDAENPTAIYTEGIRIVVEEGDMRRGMELISRNVPVEADATLACGFFSICEGNEEMAVHYLRTYGEKHHPLGTDEVRHTGEDLIRHLMQCRPARRLSYHEALKYPEDPALLNAGCWMECPLAYGRYENLCNDCFLYWLARRVSRFL